ncbi:MAG: hypothetical protein J5979_06750 [Lachnospiraceae bacterium]|nr:hypothetical protein [Lachnospiraceae bacterium]
MSIGEIIAAISAGVLCLGTFIEVSKIKINPWSSLFRWIGNSMMADVKAELKEVKEEQKELAKRQDELTRQRAIDAADRIKAEIFAFYNECQKGQRHSEGEFNHIIQQNKKYEKLIEETKEPNGVYEAEYKYILGIYEKCQKEKDFL